MVNISEAECKRLQERDAALSSLEGLLVDVLEPYFPKRKMSWLERYQHACEALKQDLAALLENRRDLLSAHCELTPALAEHFPKKPMSWVQKCLYAIFILRETATRESSEGAAGKTAVAGTAVGELGTREEA